MPVVESYIVFQVPIDQIVIGERYRKDMGDLDALAASIRDTPGRGMLQPIVLNEKHELIAGQRRLEAAKLLGWREVPCIVSRSFDDPVAALIAERDENTCRKDFLPSEAVALGKAIEKMEREAARKRQHTSRTRKGQKVGTAQGGGKSPPRSSAKGKTRDKVAEAVGMSGRTYEKAKAVVEAAEREPDKHAETAREMDRTGRVEPAYKKVKVDTAERGNPFGLSEKEIEARLRTLGLADQAIDCLKKIYSDDPLRERAFTMVADWIESRLREDKLGRTGGTVEES
jgi:ParB-like chromosome segregation protein Spo0J